MNVGKIFVGGTERNLEDVDATIPFTGCIQVRYNPQYIRPRRGRTSKEARNEKQNINIGLYGDVVSRVGRKSLI